MEVKYSVMTTSAPVTKRPTRAQINKSITELTNTQTRLEESELHYKNLFLNIEEGFAYCKMLYDEHEAPIDWIYLATNQAFDNLRKFKTTPLSFSFFSTFFSTFFFINPKNN